MQSEVSIVHGEVYIVHCEVYIVHFEVYIVQSEVYIVHCEVYIVHSEVYIVHYEVYIVHCEVYIVHCEVFIVQREMYSVQSKVYIVHLYSVQSAGRGIVHSEMPGWERTRGLQLWVNLARQDKMVEPSYQVQANTSQKTNNISTFQELKSDEIPSTSQEGVTVRVIAGESMGITSEVTTTYMETQTAHYTLPYVHYILHYAGENQDPKLLPGLHLPTRQPIQAGCS